VTVRLDDVVVIEIEPGEHGGAFFGLGSVEHTARVELEAQRRYRIDVDYPLTPGLLVRGLAVGARAVPAADPVAQAAAAAAAADVAVVIVGTDDDWETEGEDRAGIELPGEQDRLVQAVAAANPNTVVVVNAGSPVAMPWLSAVPAVLHLWFPGQELGAALADILTGVAEPGGRLPLTFPRSLAETPAAPYSPGHDGHAEYGEGHLVGYRWYDRHDLDPLFPFGHGLGYTTFSIEPVEVAGTVTAGATVTVEVVNTGARVGTEVVQVYVAQPDDDPARPRRALAGFAKVGLAAGAATTVTIAVAPRAFSRWVDDAWAISTGEHEILVGRSSRDIVTAGRLSA
jgi:beta-glucosidase